MDRFPQRMDVDYKTMPAISLTDYMPVPLPAGQIIPPGDDIVMTMSNKSVIKIPDGVGVFNVESESGDYRGQMKIIEYKGSRYIDWVNLFSPSDSASTHGASHSASADNLGNSNGE